MVRACTKSAAYEWNVIKNSFFVFLYALLNYFFSQILILMPVPDLRLKSRNSTQFLHRWKPNTRLNSWKVMKRYENWPKKRSLYRRRTKNWLVVIKNTWLFLPFSNHKDSNSISFGSQEEKVGSLEDELKDIEDLRQTVVSLMSKRKKTGKDKWQRRPWTLFQYLHKQSSKDSFFQKIDFQTEHHFKGTNN